MPEPEPLAAILARILADLAANAVELDDDMRQVLYENLWERYGDERADG